MFYKDFNLYAQKIDLKGKTFKVYSEKFSKSVSAKTDFAATHMQLFPLAGRQRVLNNFV